MSDYQQAGAFVPLESVKRVEQDTINKTVYITYCLHDESSHVCMMKVRIGSDFVAKEAKKIVSNRKDICPCSADYNHWCDCFSASETSGACDTGGHSAAYVTQSAYCGNRDDRALFIKGNQLCVSVGST